MRIGPLWIGRARTYDAMRELVIHAIDDREQNVLDFGGVKISRELIPHLLAAADGALDVHIHLRSES